ncbi:hypothetical protein MACK_001178 [Theileria orientalis]|uniref:Uncharacterized protein n=1 Tax=Theileria orientalis TaxID=68886 RepID=A0A976MCK3_THEOR|nr:hypothetical protein MACK_001178 [Theileria orientalis]
MVKSYLRYLHETTFGTVNSPLCKSIESLSPELVFSGTDDFVSLWNCKLNEIKIKFDFKKDEYNPSSLVVCFILTNNSKKHKINKSDHKYLFVGYKDGIIRRFLYTNHLLTDINNNNGLNKNGVVIINEDNVLIGHKSSITCLSLSINEELLISGSNDGNIFVWNVFDGQLLYKLKGHKNIILSTIYYFDNKLIVHEKQKNQKVPGHISKRSRQELSNNELNDRKLSENKDELGYIFSISKDNMIKIWDIINETCINTIIEPLFQFNHFIISSDNLYVNYKNNNVIHCYKINDLNEVVLLYKIENQHNYLKSKYLQHVTFYQDITGINGVDNAINYSMNHDVSTGTSGVFGDKTTRELSDDIAREVGGDTSSSLTHEDGRIDLLFVAYNKHIYMYKLLNESEVEVRRNKRLRRVNEKLKVKIHKLKKVLKLTNRKIDKSNLPSNLRSQYKYLKSLLTNEAIEAEDRTTTTVKTDNNDVADKDDDQMDDEEEKYAHGDYYKLIHIYNIGDNLNISTSGTSTSDSNYDDEDVDSSSHYNDKDVVSDDENVINSIQIYNYYTVINYNNNITNVYKFNYKALSNTMRNKRINNRKEDEELGDKVNEEYHDDVDVDKVESDEDRSSLFEKLYRLNKYHNNSIKLMKLSPDNRKLLTVSSSKIIIFNTQNNNMVNYTNNHFYYTKIDNMNESDAMTPVERDKEYVHNVTKVLFINNNNILLVLKSNRLLLYNLNTHGFYLVTSLNNIVNDHMETEEYHSDNVKNEIINVYYKSENEEEILLIVFKYNWVKKFNLNTGSIVNELNTNQQITHSQADNKYVYLGLLNNNIIIAFYNSLKIYSTLFGHSLPLTSLAVSSDLVLLASASLDKTIKIWDVKFGNILKSLLQHSKTVTQIQFLNNTHYLISISHDYKVKLYDCDEHVLITEISNFNYPLTLIEMSTYNQFFYITGSNCYCIFKYNISNDLIFVEEEHEKLQDQQISKELNLNTKILSTLEQLIETLEMDDEDMNDKLKNINNILSNVNYNLVYNMLLSLPFINIEQLIQNIINIFDIYLKDGSGGNKRNVVNLEYLIYVSLMISEIYLKQFVNNKTNIHKLKKQIPQILSNYLEMIQFNKSGLEYIKNLITINNNSLKRLI